MKQLSIFLAVAIIAILFLNGCLLNATKKNAINIVQDSTLQNYKNLTIGEALNNYKYFEKKEWKSYKTDKGRIFVPFTGETDTNGLLFLFVVNKDNKVSIYTILTYYTIGPRNEINLNQKFWHKVISPIYNNEYAIFSDVHLDQQRANIHSEDI
ncbi:MAG: hypothetical protein GY756_07970 [bacterium]|nr:hypothetical protein [bacterium]